MAISTAERATVAKVKSNLVGNTIGSMTDALFALREQKNELNERIAKIEAEYKEIEEKLLDKLTAEGSDKGSGKKATCSVSISSVANVDDWDKFYAYIKKTGYFHLLQRRPTDAACRELWDQGKKIPGVEAFPKKRLNLRAAS